MLLQAMFLSKRGNAVPEQYSLFLNDNETDWSAIMHLNSQLGLHSAISPIIQAPCKDSKNNMLQKANWKKETFTPLLGQVTKKKAKEF